MKEVARAAAARAAARAAVATGVVMVVEARAAGTGVVLVGLGADRMEGVEEGVEGGVEKEREMESMVETWASAMVVEAVVVGEQLATAEDVTVAKWAVVAVAVAREHSKSRRRGWPWN